MKKTLETPLDELLLKQNILQSDIDTVVNNLFEIFKNHLLTYLVRHVKNH